MGIFKHRLLSIGVSLLLGVQSLWGGLEEATFVWSADLESGVPSVFYSPWERDVVIGFEAEIAESIARKLNLEAKVQNTQWAGLIPGLKKGLVDAVINTVGITPEREKEVVFSIPYYVGHVQLAVRKDEESIESLQDCIGRRIGTLQSSKAANILEAIPGMQVFQYPTEAHFFKDLSNGRIDALFIDHPIALYYAQMQGDLKLVGGTEHELTFGVAMKPGNDALVRAVNGAIQEMIESGELREILERWNLWTPGMAEYTGDRAEWTVGHEAYDQYFKYWGSKMSFGDKVELYLSFMPKLFKGALMTLQISVCAMVIAIGLGFMLAIMQLYGAKPVVWLARGYIEVIRGTPLLIQLYFIFYGLPAIGIEFNAFIAGITALGLNYGAYEAENYRAGMQSVHRGQMEAARALGMTHWQGLRHVVVPQAFRVMLPPVTNDFISLLKDSSLVSVITIVDLTFAYNMVATTHFNHFGVGIVVAVIYLLLGLPFVALARWAEKRGYGRRR